MARPYPQEFRDQVVREARETRNAALVARRHGLRDRLVQRWIREAAKGGRGLAAGDPTTTQALAVAEQENRQLKHLLGEKDLEIAILRDLLKKGGSAPPTGVR